MNPRNLPPEAPDVSVDSRPPGSSFGVLLRFWREGVCVFARFIWFLIFFFIGMLPQKLVHWLLNPKNFAVSEGGVLHPEAALELVFFVIYLPFAFYFAAYGSDQLRRKS